MESSTKVDLDKTNLLNIFSELKKDCIYYQSKTNGCMVYGSCQCENCPNYISRKET
ncbi:MAG: hypothetical protein ACFFD1_03890 [Candidatus Thorarchaeota archaeon]